MQVPRQFTEVNASAAQFGIVYKHFWNESIFGFVFLAALVCFCNTMADLAKATPGVFTQSEKLSVHQGTPFGIVSKHFWNQPQTNYKNEQNTKRANTKENSRTNRAKGKRETTRGKQNLEYKQKNSRQIQKRSQSETLDIEKDRKTQNSRTKAKTTKKTEKDRNKVRRKRNKKEPKQHSRTPTKNNIERKSAGLAQHTSETKKNQRETPWTNRSTTK